MSKDFKIVQFGPSGAGKTAIIQQLIDGKIDEKSQPTVGAGLFKRSLTADGEDINLQIWDIAGQERFRSLSTIYFRSSSGGLLVYDVTNRESFKELTSWLDEFKSNACPNAPIVLIGNKSDLADDRQVEKAEADAFAQKYGLTHIEVSAKNGTNVKEAFEEIIREVKKQTVSEN